jgi:hypothetical protein
MHDPGLLQEAVAGLPADVVIKTGDRSVLTYLTAPLTRRLVGTMGED